MASGLYTPEPHTRHHTTIGNDIKTALKKGAIYVVGTVAAGAALLGLYDCSGKNNPRTINDIDNSNNTIIINNDNREGIFVENLYGNLLVDQSETNVKVYDKSQTDIDVKISIPPAKPEPKGIEKTLTPQTPTTPETNTSSDITDLIDETAPVNQPDTDSVDYMKKFQDMSKDDAYSGELNVRFYLNEDIKDANPEGHIPNTKIAEFYGVNRAFVEALTGEDKIHGYDSTNVEIQPKRLGKKFPITILEPIASEEGRDAFNDRGLEVDTQKINYFADGKFVRQSDFRDGRAGFWMAANGTNNIQSELDLAKETKLLDSQIEVSNAFQTADKLGQTFNVFGYINSNNELDNAGIIAAFDSLTQEIRNGQEFFHFRRNPDFTSGANGQTVRPLEEEVEVGVGFIKDVNHNRITQEKVTQVSSIPDNTTGSNDPFIAQNDPEATNPDDGDIGLPDNGGNGETDIFDQTDIDLDF